MEEIIWEGNLDNINDLWKIPFKENKMIDCTKELAKEYPDCVIAQRSGNITLFIRSVFGEYIAYERICKNTFFLMKITEDDVNNVLWSHNKNLFEFLEVCA